MHHVFNFNTSTDFGQLFFLNQVFQGTLILASITQCICCLDVLMKIVPQGFPSRLSAQEPCDGLQMIVLIELNYVGWQRFKVGQSVTR